VKIYPDLLCDLRIYWPNIFTHGCITDDVMSNQSNDDPVAVTTRVPTDEGSDADDADGGIVPQTRAGRD